MSPSLSRLRALPLLVVLAGLAASAVGRAQIQLPPSGSAGRGDLAPHHVCSVCAHKHYTVPADARRGADGQPIAYCSTCKRETSHAFRPADAAPARAPGAKGGLRLPPTGDLPKKAPAPGAGSPDPGTRGPADAPPAAAPGAKVEPSAAQKSGPEAAAGFVFEEIARVTDLADPLLEKAVDSLASMGASGLAAAHVELAGQSAPKLLVSARLLLAHGAETDRDAVFARARLKLPSNVSVRLADLLAEADPVRASPRYFAELLEHPTGTMRIAAERALRKHLGPSLVPLLAERLASKRPETRHLALGLILDVDDPAAVEHAFAHLSDPRPAIAETALRALAARPGADVDVRLLARAFGQRWLLRDGAYALLAIIEREDRTREALLDARHIDPLLAGLEAQDVFVSGTAAAALAGIGFRSKEVRRSEWLDQPVVDRLVYALSGKVFHDDLSALVARAAPRLELITGQALGTDGPKWLEWWVAARPGHVSRRAWIEVAPGDEVALSVQLETPGSLAVLLAPAARQPAAHAGRVAYVTEAEARELFAVFREAGVLGPERLPSVAARVGPGARRLSIAVAGRGKSFLSETAPAEAWFSRCWSASEVALERNAWQRFVPAGSSQVTLWQEQSEWWSQEHTAAERAVRLEALVLAALRSKAPSERDEGLRELERLHRDLGPAEGAGLEPYLALLDQESAYHDRVRQLALLALRAALAAGPRRTPGPASAPAGEVAAPGALAPDRARRLIQVLAARFGAAAHAEIAAVLEAAGADHSRAAAKDERPAVRVAAARVLARSPDEADRRTVIGMIDDRDPTVEVAAIEALGVARVEAARTELVVRARLGLPPVRAAALVAIGRIGGEYVLDALLLGAMEPLPELRRAAAQGLAELAEPGSLPVLVGMLAEGPASVVFGPARTGLAALGPRAWPELERVLLKSTHPARREAALILAEQCRPQPATALIQILDAHPEDARVAGELAVLTCADFRDQPDPASTWWRWYEGVVHDDAQAWFRAALERAGVSVPAAGALDGKGNRAGRLFLVEILERPEPFLVERARRELEALLGREPGALPAEGPQRTAWIGALRESILSSRDP